ncbi:hypothetical protein [Thomasclavelia cocleata]|jgi:hypothetical protein|nr:hypothetical protein [Thomasclavelia cocleata]
MKEVYEMPSIEVIKFENTDLVMMSTVTDPGEGDTDTDTEDPWG